MTFKLPEALAPWADAFAVVAPDVALSLGPSVARLAAAVGPLRTRTIHGAGDPDGYDGLTRRGIYERLLLSEWALAEEAPDEFLRRAANRELGFHQLMYRETAKARASVVLFDVGPTEFGAPRLAHFAALLMLAHRARTAGARFAWGILQNPPEGPSKPAGLMLDVTVDNVDWLRVTKHGLAPGDADLDAWVALERAAGSWDDLWVVGPRATASRWRERVAKRPGTTGGFIEVREPTAPGARRLEVKIHQRGGARDVSLDLPDEGMCVRLLRNALRRVEPPKPTAPPPRVQAKVPNRTRSVISNPLLLSHGAKVIGRTTGGGLLIFGVPGSSRGGTPRPRIMMPRPGEHFLAVGWGQRRLVLLSSYLGALRLYDWAGNVFPWDLGVRKADPEVFATICDLGRDEELLAPLHIHRLSASSPRTASVLDQHRRLWRLDASGVTLASTDVDTAFVRGDDLVVRASLGGSAATRVAVLGVSLGGEVVERAPGEWVLAPFDGRPLAEVTRVPAGARVLGVGGYSSRKTPPLVCVDADGRTLLSCVGESPVRLHVAPSRIAHAVVEASGARVAFVTEDGALGVFDTAKNELLMRFVPGSWS